MKTKIQFKPLLYSIGKQLKISIKKLFHIKRKQIVRFKTKTGIVRTYKQNYSLFLNYKKHFQKIVKPINHHVLYNFFMLFKKNYKQRIKKFRIYNKNLNRRFLYKFFIKKQDFIKQLFIRTFFLFFEKIQQSLYLINAFPQFILKFIKRAINKKDIKKYINIFASKSMDFFNFENLNLIKLEFAKVLQNILLKSKNISYITRFLTNKVFFSLINKIIDSIVQKTVLKRRVYFNFQKWVSKYQLFLKKKYYDSLNARQKKKQEYAENYRLLKEKFKNNLNTFLEYKKAQDRLKLIKYRKKHIRSSALIYRLNYLYITAKKNILRKITLIPGNSIYKNSIKHLSFKFTEKKYDIIKKLSSIKTVVPENIKNYNQIILKLSFISTRLLTVFISQLNKIKNNQKFKTRTKLDQLNAYILNIHTRFKKFSFNKIKKNILYTKKLPISSNLHLIKNQLSNLNILKNKNILVKARFNNYMQNNTLFNKMNLMQNMEITDLLKNTSDILRAEHFRNLLNKEQAYFETFYKQQNPLQLLTTITGHNIYLTLFISKPYKILWKASAGMLGLKNFRRAKKHQMTFKDLLIRCQLFLARNRILLQRPLHLRLRYLNYYGTKNFLSFFISLQKPQYTFENYKNIKIYNFYRNAHHLCNNYALQFMSMIWSRTKNNYLKIRRQTFQELVEYHKNKIKAFPLTAEDKTTSVSFVDLRKNARLDKFFNANPFIIK